MKLSFCKYHGAGNDFILMDGINQQVYLDREEIAAMCSRRFGIGADGFILLESSEVANFRMRYFNSDGKEGSLCGNGARCASYFAYKLGIVASSLNFEAVDGIHQAMIYNREQSMNFYQSFGDQKAISNFSIWANREFIVRVKMNRVNQYSFPLGAYFLNTGSPHFVQFTADQGDNEFATQSLFYRHHKEFGPEGCNVNFVQELSDNSLRVRTFERGVEAETLSCGTGVVAAALAHALKESLESNIIRHIATKGGNLTVEFTGAMKDKRIEFDSIFLTGPVQFVFEGFYHFNSPDSDG